MIIEYVALKRNACDAITFPAIVLFILVRKAKKHAFFCKSILICICNKLLNSKIIKKYQQSILIMSYD